MKSNEKEQKHSLAREGKARGEKRKRAKRKRCLKLKKRVAFLSDLGIAIPLRLERAIARRREKDLVPLAETLENSKRLEKGQKPGD